MRDTLFIKSLIVTREHPEAPQVVFLDQRIHTNCSVDKLLIKGINQDTP